MQNKVNVHFIHIWLVSFNGFWFLSYFLKLVV